MVAEREATKAAIEEARAMSRQETVSGCWGVLVQISQLERVAAAEEETAEEAAEEAYIHTFNT